MSLRIWVLVVAGSALTGARLTVSRDEVTKAQEKIKKLPHDICGRPGTFDTRIVGGGPAEAGEFPWMAALGYLSPTHKTPQWRCGGTLITAQHVVTAAHCVPVSTGYKLSLVRLGDLDLNDTFPEPWGKPVTIPITMADITVHAEYNDTTKVNDIALIKLRHKVIFTRYVRPICLPSVDFHEESFVDDNAYVAGWGVTDIETYKKTNYNFDAARSTRLQKVELVVRDLEKCKQTITANHSELIVDNRILCASLLGKDSCPGDSGGPLMKFQVTDTSFTWHILGIVSYGPVDCGVDLPGAYTRVAEFMGWILDHLDDL